METTIQAQHTSQQEGSKMQSIVSAYANPLSYYITSLIFSRVVKNTDELLKSFSVDSQLDDYVMCVVDQLITDGMINIQNEEFQLSSVGFTEMDQFEPTSIYPKVFESLANRVSQDFKTGRHNETKEALLLYSLPDNPYVATRLRQISINLKKELDLLEEETRTEKAKSVRMIGFVNAKPINEDFSV